MRTCVFRPDIDIVIYIQNIVKNKSFQYIKRKMHLKAGAFGFLCKEYSG